MNRHLLKFFSFFIAIFLWIYVISTEKLEMKKEIDIIYLLPEKLALANDVPKVAQVGFRGPRAFLRSLSKKKQSITIDVIAHLQEGKLDYDFSLSAQQFSIPIGVEITSILPPDVRVKLDRKIKKKVKVRTRLDGEISDAHKILKQELYPKKVEIEGAKIHVDKIKTLWTKPISVSGLIGEGERRVYLDFPFPHIKKLSVEELIYSYNIKPHRPNLTLNNLKIQILSSKKDIQVSHRFASLWVYSEGKDEETIRHEGIQVVSDIPDGLSGKQQITLEAHLPSGVHLIRIFPPKIRVTIP
jgi:YbbR domain-containing protein